MEALVIVFKMNRTIIHIATRDRPTELFGLLQSLRTQTYQDFDVLILDDGGGTPFQNYYFLNYIIARMKMEGTNITIIRNNIASGVSSARQQLVDYTMKELKHEYICRLDDDILLEKDYLEQLMMGIKQGYDLMSGLTIPFASPVQVRDIIQIEPIVGECILDDKGELIMNMDDCAVLYTEHKILPTHHFRSCALYKRELHEKGVDYNSRLSKNGFREEQILSFKAILKGFKLGVNTGAINYHLMTPSGGERDTMNMTEFNQEVLDSTVKRMFEDHGDFIKTYNEKFNIVPKERTEGEFAKGNNLVYKNKKVVNLLK